LGGKEAEMNGKTVLLLAIAALGAAGVLLACTTSTPTSTDGGPTDTPEALPTDTVLSPPTWETVEPTPAAAAGRTDCPEGWLAYVDPQDRFSICYPGDFVVLAGADGVNVESPRAADQDENLYGVAVGWNDTPQSVYYPPNSDNCPQWAVGDGAGEFLELSASGQTVPACLTQNVLEGTSVPVGNAQGAIPLAADGSADEGYIQFAIGFTGVTGGDASQIPVPALEIFETLQITLR
jgi:hypothetical protein